MVLQVFRGGNLDYLTLQNKEHLRVCQMNLQNRSLELQPVPECHILVLDKADEISPYYDVA
jgi:hypothetical protein